MKKLFSVVLMLGLFCSFGSTFAAEANVPQPHESDTHVEEVMPRAEPCPCGGWFTETVTRTDWYYIDTRKCACPNPISTMMDYQWQRDVKTVSKCTKCGQSGSFTERELYGYNKGWKHGSVKP